MSLNPNAWLYSNLANGTTPSIFTYDKLCRQYHQEQAIKLVQEMAAITGSIVVAARYVSERERRKHKDKRLQLGRRAYFVFPKDDVPIKVYEKLMKEGENRGKTA